MADKTGAAIDLNPHHLQEVMRILNVYVPDVEVRAFGSRVKWTAKAYSDLDLALMTEHPIPLEKEALLHEAFDDSTLPFKVDFVDWASTSEAFRDIISKESVVIRPAQRLPSDEAWSVMPLEEALDALLDYRGKTPEKTSAGVPLITAKIVKNGRIEPATEFIAREKYSAWMTRGLPRTGDVLLTTEAPLGEVAQLDTGQVALAQRVVALRGKVGVLDNTYLRYLLQTGEMQEQLAARATGTTVLGVKQSELRKIALRLPSMERQRAVASLLSGLDSRITLLQETNATLEAIAQALFQSWFIDFDPVRAKAKGRPTEGIDATTACLFPDGFEESELGFVPKGWKIGELQDLLVLQRGFDLPASERTGGDYPLIAASGPSGTHHISMAKGPGVVTGRSGVLGKVFLTLEDYWPLNTTLWVKEFKRAAPCYAFELLKLLDFSSFNAGSAVPTLNRNHVHSLKYLLPPVELVKAYEGMALPIHRRALENNRQAQTLTQLRDTLLPRLISGQLRLPEADKQIQGAVA